MATRYCPECGAEYVATVTQCVDCLVALRDDVELERRAAEQADADEPAGGQKDPGEEVVYELGDWDPDQRVLLARILDSEGIAHVWEATDLVVRQADEARVEALMDDLDTSGEAGLDTEGDQVVYEVADWAPELRDRLVALLDRGSIPYAWDENRDLVVDAGDEDEVERLLDQVEYPDALPEDDTGGTEAQDVMSSLFVAADRLMHDPEDHEGVLDAVEGAQRAESLPVPYGFEPRVWENVVGRATAVRQALEADTDGDQVVELAKDLRATLRQYV
jgi:hypothetical protein